MKRGFIVFCGFLLIGCMLPLAGYGAYHHEGEDDSGNFLAIYPQKAHTKLDSCALCHKGGSYTIDNKPVTYGSCQNCHYIYDLTGTVHGSFVDTLNEYGLAYRTAGSSSAAVTAINGIDSDGDGFTNSAEILADRYPGDANDDPTKVPAPARIYTKAQLKTMTQHSQFMLMNATRSDDNYAEYAGVPMKDLLDDAGIVLGIATGIIVYSPDGFSQSHPLYPTPGSYHVYGNMEGQAYQYPPATYYYEAVPDKTLNPTTGWCYWDAPSCAGRQNGDSIYVGDGGLKAILAITREGNDLVTGVLNDQNKLDGEGPLRVVVPQVVPSAPDQSSRTSNGSLIWPYDSTWDHNAGACSRTATIIKVEPLPEGTTDIDVYEAGWDYVDQEKIIIYGAIDGADTNGNGILDTEEGSDPSKDFDDDGEADFEDEDTATFNNPNGEGQILIHTTAGDLVSIYTVSENDESIPSTGSPLTDTNGDGTVDYTTPFGITGFSVTGLDAGATVTIALRFPSDVPTTAKYYKVTSTNGWSEIPIGSNDGDDLITLTLTDGDPDTDADGIANGVIVDPGAVIVPAEAADDDDDDLCFMDAAGNASAHSSLLVLLALGFLAVMAGLGLRKRID